MALINDLIKRLRSVGDHQDNWIGPHEAAVIAAELERRRGPETLPSLALDAAEVDAKLRSLMKECTTGGLREWLAGSIPADEVASLVHGYRTPSLERAAVLARNAKELRPGRPAFVRSRDLLVALDG